MQQRRSDGSDRIATGRVAMTVISYELIVLGGIPAFAGGFVAGFAGFGFGLIFAPVFLILSGRPHEVVFQTVVLGALLSLAVLAEARRSVAPTVTLIMVTVAVLGTPIGLFLLSIMAVGALKATISFLAIMFTLLRVVRLPLGIPAGLKALAIGGFLGGILNGCTGMGGSVPALVVTLQRREVRDSRAILVAFNLASCLLAIIVALESGLARASWLVSSLWLAPFVALGMVSGMRAVRLVSRDAFNLFVTVVIGVSGLAGLVSVVAG